MKKSIFVATALLQLCMTAIPACAMDDMVMPPSKITSQNNIAGKGIVVAVDKSVGNVTLKHEAIRAIGWGAMTMDFKVTDKLVLEKLVAGDKIEFTLIKRGHQYLISKIN